MRLRQHDRADLVGDRGEGVARPDDGRAAVPVAGGRIVGIAMIQ